MSCEQSDGPGEFSPGPSSYSSVSDHLPYTDDLSYIDEVGVPDLRVEREQHVNRRSVAGGDDPERVAALYSVGRCRARDVDDLSEEDQVRVGDLRVDCQQVCQADVQAAGDLAHRVAPLHY